MKKTVGTVVTVVIVLALLVLGIVFGRAALSEQQLGTLKLLLIVCGCSIVYCFTVGEIAQNFSQMDKLWSLLPIAYAWIIAITVGCILELIVLLAGDMRYGTEIDLAHVFLGIVFSFMLAQIVRFFTFNVDYLRIENVQFEDEDYYYYVKAVPKVMVYTSDPEDDEFDPPSGEDAAEDYEG